MLDHLVYAAPDLDQAIDSIERRLGVRPAPGGKHTGGLTHNALLSLGAGSYLELIAPVRDSALSAGLPFGLETVTEPRLITWAVSVDDIEGRVEAAKKKGYDPGAVVSGGRDLPDGSSLNWRLAVRPQPAGDGLVPFLIQWLSDPHPSTTAPAGCQFVALRAEHPDPAGIQAVLDALAVEMEAVSGPVPRLIATLDTPNGRVELS
jgi:glyoxalase-like protein